MDKIPTEVDFVRMAERDGAEAFVSGETEASNPFTDEALNASWLRGYREAAAHHAK